jgi:Fe-S-cluster-containing dehydrogenase component
MTQYGMLIEANRCLGCSICTRACKDEFIGNAYPGYSAAQPAPDRWYGPSEWPNQAPFLTLNVQHGQNWMEYSIVEKGTFPNITAQFVYMPCMQCQNAPCVAASEENAVTQRKDGIVLIDPVNSANQRQIVQSCPYSRIYWNAAAAIPQKCTFCAHLVDQGLNPKCVDACPVSAITFGDISNPSSTVSQKIASLKAQPLHPEYGTKPAVYYAGLI